MSEAVIRKGKKIIHVLDRRPGSEDAHGFAMLTLCGRNDLEHISAMNPGDTLRGVHWGKAYRVDGRWCKNCKTVEASIT